MEFRDLKKQYQVLKVDIDTAISHVLCNADFISGAQVKELEKQLAEYVGVKHCITCANGTDALTLALMAWEVGAGDAVFIPDFTFFSTGESPAFLGAHPVFVDIDVDTYNMDPKCLEQSIIRLKKEGKYIPKVVIAVDLFGQPADYREIRRICNQYGLLLLEDGAQGFGGVMDGKKVCSFGDISTTSFFPAKPLGCYGDGGAIFTNHEEWAAQIRSLAVHGKNMEDKYDNVRLGMNSRLDTLQAAILLVKLKAFQEYELEAVNRVADWYREQLFGSEIEFPVVKEGYVSSWAQYTIKLPEEVNRSRLQKKLKEDGIPTMIYYRKPMHLQGAFKNIGSNAQCPVTEKVCNQVLSLPMHPYLNPKDISNIVNTLKKQRME